MPELERAKRNALLEVAKLNNFDPARLKWRDRAGTVGHTLSFETAFSAARMSNWATIIVIR
jgi:hypothetical protein